MQAAASQLFAGVCKLFMHKPADGEKCDATIRLRRTLCYNSTCGTVQAYRSWTARHHLRLSLVVSRLGDAWYWIVCRRQLSTAWHHAVLTLPNRLRTPYRPA